MSQTVCLVYTTCSTLAEANELGVNLVDEKLAACATALPGAHSMYRWNGKVQRADECQLLLKTVPAALPALEARLKHLHTYECPEFLVVTSAHVSAEYAAWVADAVVVPVRPA